MDNQYLELGTVAVLFLFFMKEFFAWLKSRKNGNENDNLLSFISKTVRDESEKTDLKINSLKSQFQNLKDNDLHTITKDLCELKTSVGDVNINVARLQTIINERIPKK